MLLFFELIGIKLSLTFWTNGTERNRVRSPHFINYSSGVADKVVQEVTPLGTISYTYDSIGRRTSMTVTGQPAVNYGYDANSRLTDINTLINGVAAGFSLRYDNLGRRTGITLPNGVTTNYTYDNASRLLNLEHLNPAQQVLESLTYAYDATGNRIGMTRPSVNLPLRDPVSSTSYNDANQMLSFNYKNIIHDNNGNMTSVTNSCGITNYTWDARNRLVGINGYKSDCTLLTASFAYDVLGRRIENTINGSTTQYVYDGLDIIQEKQNGTVTANYIRTLNIDEPLSRIKADGTVRYYQTDALGSVIALTDEIGAIKTQYTYDPFGNVTVSGEASDNPFQYTGRENDGTGLYYYRERYYSSELQRFISEDPIGLMDGIKKLGKPLTETNLYIYAQNNPLRFNDPFGLSSCEDNCNEFRWKCNLLAGIGGIACNTACYAGCVWATGGAGVVFSMVVCAGVCVGGTGYLQLYCYKTYSNCMGNCKKCK